MQTMYRAQMMVIDTLRSVTLHGTGFPLTFHLPSVEDLQPMLLILGNKAYVEEGMKQMMMMLETRLKKRIRSSKIFHWLLEFTFVLLFLFKYVLFFFKE